MIGALREAWFSTPGRRRMRLHNTSPINRARASNPATIKVERFSCAHAFKNFTRLSQPPTCGVLELPETGTPAGCCAAVALGVANAAGALQGVAAGEADGGGNAV
jgi:hypothetical protein